MALPIAKYTSTSKYSTLNSAALRTMPKWFVRPAIRRILEALTGGRRFRLIFWSGSPAGRSRQLAVAAFSLSWFSFLLVTHQPVRIPTPRFISEG